MTKLLPCLEWDDTLALKPTDLSPERRAALEAHLATCPGCAATYADYQSLITRLRALPRPALPPLAPLTPDLFDDLDAQAHTDHLYDNIDALLPPPAPESASPPTRLPRLWRRGWERPLSLIAAVLLLTVVVGSMALLFHRVSTPPVSSTPEFHLRPGWTVLVEYSGVGSQTITGQDIETPRLWGSAYGCVGSGGLDILLTGKNASQQNFGMGEDKCSALPPPVVSPVTFSFNNTPLGKLDTIKVTADAKTHWFFQFTQAVHQPVLTLGSEWKYETSFGGTSSGTFAAFQESVSSAYKTWGLVFTCIGTGSSFAELTPSVGEIPLPPCDGQPHLSKVHYDLATSLQEASVRVADGITWDMAFFGCVDEQHCASD